jgi:hypothetical protein
MHFSFPSTSHRLAIHSPSAIVDDRGLVYALTDTLRDDSRTSIPERCRSFLSFSESMGNTDDQSCVVFASRDSSLTYLIS